MYQKEKILLYQTDVRGNPKLYHFTVSPDIEQTIFLSFGFLTSEMNK